LCVGIAILIVTRLVQEPLVFFVYGRPLSRLSLQARNLVQVASHIATQTVASHGDCDAMTVARLRGQFALTDATS
jgi:hypothetical protein